MGSDSVPIDCTRFSDRWSQDNFGIWRDPSLQSLSYPEDGNDTCFQIEEESFWFRHRNAVIQRLVTRFPPRGPFFDVGGGNGFVAKGLQDCGIETVLVEPGAAGVANAQKRGIENVVQSMWSPSVVHPGVASAVGLFDVVEHIEDDLGFLKGVSETIQDSGLVFITVPAYQWLWSFEDVHAGHFRRYTLSGLSRLLVNAGFHVEFASYLFAPLPVPILLQRSLPTLLGLRKSVTLERTNREHTSRPSLLGRQVERILLREQKQICQLQPISFGSSCVVVGRRMCSTN